LKVLVENTVAFFYPDGTRGYSCQHGTIIKLNPWDLKVSLPQANLDATGEGFVATFIEEESNKLVEDSTMIASQIMEVLPVDMQLK
jgi:hypothetical protein